MVYNKDPKKHKNAKPLKKINWNEILDITGKKFTPGMNVPFDPIASQLAQKIGIKVIVCDGRDLKNLDNIIEGKEFVGTTIK
jgi:uridylate kinase